MCFEQTDGVTPNTRFLNHMMQAAVGAKQWVAAEAMFRAMTEKYGHANATRQSTLHFVQVGWQSLFVGLASS